MNKSIITDEELDFNRRVMRVMHYFPLSILTLTLLSKAPEAVDADFFTALTSFIREVKEVLEDIVHDNMHNVETFHYILNNKEGQFNGAAYLLELIKDFNIEELQKNFPDYPIPSCMKGHAEDKKKAVTAAAEAILKAGGK